VVAGRQGDALGREQPALGVDLLGMADWKSFHDQRRKEGHDLYLYGWSVSTPDPERFLFPLFHSTSPDNFGRYGNAKVDALLEQARQPMQRNRSVNLPPSRAERPLSRMMTTCPLAGGNIVGQDHFAHRFEPFLAEEHVLRAGESDASGAECARLGCILRRVPPKRGLILPIG
jgi:hypothetical protein